ncbi:hypothetical protein [Rhizobium sp. S163]|uniref:hypothetical protein n=1 Tax=Rhizobium sp. S163 TaxID=3055039 RepID=UPI0025A9B2F6|nr:hypothetical protein [Rhizobium sp. S163]MDM9643878.1 hypothetical protein [Rhizobium sp. S163]
MKKRIDLITATLKLLQADGGIGQMPEAENVEDIDGLIDGKLAELDRRGIYSAFSRDEFDDEYIDPLAIILANAAAVSYGVPKNPDSQLAAENLLRSMRESDWLPADVIPSLYF